MRQLVTSISILRIAIDFGGFAQHTPSPKRAANRLMNKWMNPRKIHEVFPILHLVN